MLGISRQCHVTLDGEDVRGAMKQGWDSMIEHIEAKIRHQTNPYDFFARKAIKALDLQSDKAKPTISRTL